MYVLIKGEKLIPTYWSVALMKENSTVSVCSLIICKFTTVSVKMDLHIFRFSRYYRQICQPIIITHRDKRKKIVNFKFEKNLLISHA